MNQLNLEIDLKLTGGTKKVNAPRNLEEAYILLYNYRYLFKSRYSEAEVYQEINAWLQAQSINYTLEVLADSKSKILKKFIAFIKEHGFTKRLKPFTKEELQPQHEFYVHSKTANARFITDHLKQLNIKVVKKSTENTTHTFYYPALDYIEDDQTLLDPQSAFDYLKAHTQIEASPFNDSQTDKIVTLLTSNNNESIDLGLNLLKTREAIEKELLVPLLIAFCTKKETKGKFKAGTKSILKKAAEYHIKDPADAKIVANHTQWVKIIDVLENNQTDAVPFIRHTLRNPRGKFENKLLFSGEEELTLAHPQVIPALLAEKETLLSPSIHRLTLGIYTNGWQTTTPYDSRVLKKLLPYIDLKSLSIRENNCSFHPDFWQHAPQLKMLNLCGLEEFVGDHQDTTMAVEGISILFNPHQINQIEKLLSTLYQVHSAEVLSICTHHEAIRYNFPDIKILNQSLQKLKKLRLLSLEIQQEYRKQTLDVSILLQNTSITQLELSANTLVPLQFPTTKHQIQKAEITAETVDFSVLEFLKGIPEIKFSIGTIKFKKNKQKTIEIGKKTDYGTYSHIQNKILNHQQINDLYNQYK